MLIPSARCWLALGVLLLLGACVPASQPFRMVQGCLSDADGIELFAAEMRAIARDEKLKVFDTSEAVSSASEAFSDQRKYRTHGSRSVNMTLNRNDRALVTASNLGMLGFEVYLGFSEGDDPEFAHAFAERVLQRLARHWQFDDVPSGMGAKSKGGCP